MHPAARLLLDARRDRSPLDALPADRRVPRMP